MFKAIVSLRALQSISDDQVEYQLRDRLSFMRVENLGLGLEDKVPDAKTVWLYREQLGAGGRDREVVRGFAYLEAGLLGDGRPASSTPRSCRCLNSFNSGDDNARIKEGDTRGLSEPAGQASRKYGRALDQ